MKCRGRRGPMPIFIPPIGFVHSTTTIATARRREDVVGDLHVAGRVRRGRIGPEETTSRVSGFVTLPWSGFGRVPARRERDRHAAAAGARRRGDGERDRPRSRRTSACVRRASRRADRRGAAVRRPDRRGRLDRERHPGLPLAHRHLGAVRPDGVRDDRRLPPRPREGLGLLLEAPRDARRREAERRPPRARRARAPRARRGDDHPERRPAPPGGRLGERDRGARLDPHRELPRLRPPRAVRARRRAPAGARVREAAAQVLKPDVVMFGELLPEGAIERAFELARGAGLVLVVGSSLEVYPVAGLPGPWPGRLAIVNSGPDAVRHARADLKIDAPAGETLVTDEWLRLTSAVEMTKMQRCEDRVRLVVVLGAAALAVVPGTAVGPGSAEGLSRRRAAPRRDGNRRVRRGRQRRRPRRTGSRGRAHARRRFPKLNENGYPTTFSIVGAVLDARCQASWYRVKLPMRPNGVVGYVRPARGRRRSR